MSKGYAQGTTVTAGKTEAEIKDQLARRGIVRIGTMVELGSFTLGFEHQGVAYKIVLPLPDPNSDAFTKYRQGSTIYDRADTAARELYEKELNRRWRAFGLVIKGKLVAVEEGISTIEREFIGNVVLPGGKTIAETYADHLPELAARGNIPALMPPGGGSC